MKKPIFWTIAIIVGIFALTSCSTPSVQSWPTVIETHTEIHTKDPLPAFMTSTPSTGSELVQEEKTPKGIAVFAKFTDEFVQKYQYEDAKGYRFAVKVDGHYFNTFRNDANGVSNSTKHGLTWAVPAYLFKEWYTWHIPFGDIKVANAKWSYGFHTETLALPHDWSACGWSCFDVQISPVKEGVPTHHIDWTFYF